MRKVSLTVVDCSGRSWFFEKAQTVKWLSLNNHALCHVLENDKIIAQFLNPQAVHGQQK